MKLLIAEFNISDVSVTTLVVCPLMNDAIPNDNAIAAI